MTGQIASMTGATCPSTDWRGLPTRQLDYSHTSMETQFTTNEENEAGCRERLRNYLTRLGWTNVEHSVDDLLSLSSGFEERFSWIDRFVSPEFKTHILVSGSAVGSELIVARRHGFGEVHGTEVDPELFAIGESRFAGDPSFKPHFCSGVRLPYASGTFGCVVSGHVIEHSRAPFRYLAEHLRVLQPGGWLFLEFPHRYHPVELHTTTKSMEWLPWPLRDLALRVRALRWRGRDAQRARMADAVRVDLRPVSVWQIRAYLRVLLASRARIVEIMFPSPGVVRLMISRSR
ncbi:MAG: class I SAM-dependent methyltransferase [Thermoanaerobaculia bacterium]